MRRLSLILFSLAGLLLNAQEISLTVEAPTVVAVGEQFRVSWSANTRGGEFQAPEFGDFYKLSGPQTSFSSSTQMINGKVTSSVSNSFVYYLQATKEGKFTIQPGRFIHKNKEYLSDPLTIEVVEAAAVNNQNAAIQQNPAAADPQTSVSSEDLFVRLLVSKKKVYTGEHVLATLKIYSKVSLSGIQEVKYPDFNSFLKEDLETPPLRNLERENVNGQIYASGVLQRFLLYPQKSGTIEIEPASLTVLLQQRSRNNDPFFGDFFSSFSTVPKMIASLPVEIEVVPLPEDPSGNFSGAVGDFTVSSSISDDTVMVNNALTYKIVLKGTGNIKLSGVPEPELSPDIEIYEPKTSTSVVSGTSGSSGNKSFEYVLIPRHYGTFTIPALEYRYFDTSSGTYRTIRTEQHNFYAQRGADEEETAQVYGGVSKENVKFLGKDIRYINSGNPKLKKRTRIIIDNSSFFYAYLIVLLVFLLIIFFRREQVKRNADLARVKNRKAGRVAVKRLKKAAGFMNSGSSEEFFEEILKALWGYLSDKYTIPVSELNIESVTSLLEGKKVNSDLISDLKAVIGICEYSRFSPESDSAVVSGVYSRAERIINAFENLKQ